VTQSLFPRERAGGDMAGILHTLRGILSFVSKAMQSVIINNDSEIALKLRRKMYKTNCMIDTGVFIKNKYNFEADKHTALYHGCYILNLNGTFKLGNNSHLGAYCLVNVCHGSVDIGEDVAIGPGTKIISYSNYYKYGKKISDERITGPIIIGNNVFVGANCTILPGTIIQDNVVVGAGTIVKGILETNNIYAGSPCKIIRSNWYH
jgi:acetyltransferase-like isoleucine patch superfamily enzyme